MCRISILRRISQHVSLAAIVAAVAACAAAPHVPSQLPPECDPTPPHSLVYVPVAPNLAIGFVRGAVFESATRRPVADALVLLRSDSIRRATTDSLGRFAFADVRSGRYQLRILRVGFIPSSDTIVAPPGGLAIEATQQPMLDVGWCAYQHQLASEPALAVARAETLQFERRLPDGARIRHTVIATGVEDDVAFVSLLENVGSRPVGVERLCYPWADASVLRTYHGVGPACYSSATTLQPGSTMTVRTGGALRGAPGRYHFRVHPVDPPLLDAEFDLRLARFRRP